MGFGPGPGFGGFGHVVGMIVGGLLGFFLFLIAVALIFLLVRFLLVATRAAHIYVAKNSPPVVVTPQAAATPTVAAPTSPRPAATKAAATPRTPTPPTA